MERLERALSTDLKRNASQLNGDILVAIVWQMHRVNCLHKSKYWNPSMN